MPAAYRIRGWSETPPGDGWLRKRLGGSGGSHVGCRKRRRTHYWQERVEGEPVSALVLGRRHSRHGAWPQCAMGRSVTRRRHSATAVRCGPATLPERAADANGRGCAGKLSRRRACIGLNSVDFLVGPGGWHLIEVNPRPGATLDIFRPAEGSLFELHVTACRGRLPTAVPNFPSRGAAGADRLCAARDVKCVPELDWPDWTADRQPAGTQVRAGAPFCTVTGGGRDRLRRRGGWSRSGATAVAAALGAV